MNNTSFLLLKNNSYKLISIFLIVIISVCLVSCQSIPSETIGQNFNLEKLKIDKVTNNFNTQKANLSAVDVSKQSENYQEIECEEEGNAVSVKIKELNILKNRMKFPLENDFDKNITLAKMLNGGNDINRWSIKKAARISGYVYDVKPGGVETCNCKSKEIDKRDTHIEIIMDPNNGGKSKRVIVEVTSRIRKIMQAKGLNWSTKNIRDRYLGRFVELEGWMLFDMEHANAAENTNPGRPRNWRATAWEIHPITNIKLLDKNPNLFH